ncbi:hypothetical protein DYY88_09810 [Leptolyngbya iicbica LK]|uniref:ABC-three component systems C-terminal domain-containing protein n=3 Tax=Cyanophyceae TaxID=3028117 RepID=A0A4Q7E8W7_9CYAN|nr:hypothetical protein DYY88_09810 [Leptolyngbya sp. LK]
MISDEDMRPISPQPPLGNPSADHVMNGIPIPKEMRLVNSSPEEWEAFIEEWASAGTVGSYKRIRRHSGSGDMGIDVAGYVDDDGLSGVWDNFQCKRYATSLSPSMVWVEFGKIIYYSFKNQYAPPRRYFFVAPKGVGTTLSKLMDNPAELKESIKNNWETYCLNKITTTANIPLEGDLLDWFEDFDFSIFSYKTAVELIKEHATTPFHSVRFGGGLDLRPAPDTPPETPTEKESRYIRQIFDAYSEHLSIDINSASDISSSLKPELNNHMLRQRERFYSAESLRVFARDTVPPGTFDRLQSEILDGVIDICEDTHPDGLTRMNEVIRESTRIALTSNPLVTVTETKDRQGICHQLANDDKLIWVPSGKEV